MITTKYPAISNKAIWVLTIATALAVPLRIVGVSGEQFMLGLAVIAGLVLSALSTDVRKLIGENLTSTSGKLIGLVFVAWLVVLPFSYNVGESLEITLRTAGLVFGALVIASVLKLSDEKHEVLLKCLVGAAVFCAFLALVSLNGFHEVLAVLKARMDLKIHVVKALKSYATASLCLLPLVIYGGRRLGGKWQLAAYVYLPMVFLIIFQTGTRSAMAGLLAMGITFVGVTVLVKRVYMKTALVSIVLGASALIYWIREDRFVYERTYGDMNYLPGWLIDPHRQQIWRFVYDRFLEHPWVGNGIDQLNKLPGAHDTVAQLGQRAHVVPSHPHNFAIEILGETGLIGFLPVVMVLIYFAWKLTKSALARYDEKAMAQLLLFVAFWTCSLFSYSIWAVWWQLILFVLFGILWAMSNRPSERAPGAI